MKFGAVFPQTVIGSDPVALRGIYLRDGTEQDDPTYVTELQFPVERR